MNVFFDGFFFQFIFDWDGCFQQIFPLDQIVSDRAADQTSGDQAESGGCCADRGGTFDAEVFHDRPESACGPVSADHRDRAGAHAEHLVKVQKAGKADCNAVLRDDEYDHQTKEHKQRFAALFQYFDVGLETDRRKEEDHKYFFQRIVKFDFNHAGHVKNTGHDCEDQAADDRRRDAESAEESHLADEIFSEQKGDGSNRKGLIHI